MVQSPDFASKQCTYSRNKQNPKNELACLSIFSGYLQAKVWGITEVTPNFGIKTSIFLSISFNLWRLAKGLAFPGENISRPTLLLIRYVGPLLQLKSGLIPSWFLSHCKFWDAGKNIMNEDWMRCFFVYLTDCTDFWPSTESTVSIIGSESEIHRSQDK